LVIDVIVGFLFDISDAGASGVQDPSPVL
jgi:hypothetical protein